VSSYLFRSVPFEELQDRSGFAIFEKAIEERRKLDLEYYSDTKKRYSPIEELRPLRILYMEGNFYLAVLSIDRSVNNGFKFLRISKIGQTRLLDERFHETEEVLSAHRFLDEEMQSPFSRFGENLQKVVLIGDAKAAAHFGKKCHFPSQTHRIKEDRSIEIELYLTEYMEIAPLIKRWIPHLRLVTPKDWSDQLRKELHAYCEVYKDIGR